MGLMSLLDKAPPPSTFSTIKAGLNQNASKVTDDMMTLNKHARFAYNSFQYEQFPHVLPQCSTS